MNTEKLEQGILKTGFPLEFQVGKACQRHGWSTINSKYYVDDVQGVARELDIVAYKVATLSDVQVCTTILISCKKNPHDAWALIAQEKNTKDPNMNWYPLHAWTNQPVIRYVLDKTNWSSEYIAQAKHNAFFKSLIEPKHHIFAYQLVNKNSGKAQDTKNIFDSVSSLMKAQWYEIDTREKTEGKSKRRVMNFNLVSIADAEIELCKLDETDEGDVKVSIENVDWETYIASYIIDRQQIVSRINFVRFPAFEQILTWFDEMHDFNTQFFDQRIANYYQSPFVSPDSIEVFLNLFANRIVNSINAVVTKAGGEPIQAEHIEIYRRRGDRKITVGIPIWDLKTVEALNKDEDATNRTRKAFSELYRYEGTFAFDMDIPF
jgi:hypothetical protein